MREDGEMAWVWRDAAGRKAEDEAQALEAMVVVLAALPPSTYTDGTRRIKHRRNMATSSTEALGAASGVTPRNM